MIVLVGESASGKSSIQNYIVQNSNISKIVTYTTRMPRPNEKDGVDYHFISEENFKMCCHNNQFIEYSKYNNWLYGTKKEGFSANKIVILTPHGLRQLKNNNIPCVSFYIRVPRRDRLIKILQRGDNIEEAYRRNLSDVGMFDGIEDEVDVTIDNPKYEYSVKELGDMIITLYQEQLEKLNKGGIVYV